LSLPDDLVWPDLSVPTTARPDFFPLDPASPGPSSPDLAPLDLLPPDPAVPELNPIQLAPPNPPFAPTTPPPPVLPPLTPAPLSAIPPALALPTSASAPLSDALSAPTSAAPSAVPPAVALPTSASAPLSAVPPTSASPPTGAPLPAASSAPALPPLSTAGPTSAEQRAPQAPHRPHGRIPLLARLPLALQERLDLDRRAVIGLSVLLLLALGYGAQHFWAGRPEPVAVPVADGSLSPGTSSPDPGPPVGAATGPALGSAPGQAAGSASSATPAAPDPGAGPSPGPSRPSGVVVDVAGKVRAPGLRTLPQGARVQDALQAAGGPLPGTDLTGLNLARPLGDGEEVVVGVPSPPGGTSASGPASGPLSLNNATAQQLDALPGVGPVLAQRIVQYREQHGGFQSVDQLRHVSGFGERRLQDLRALLRP